MHPRVHFQCLPVIVSKSVHIHPVFGHVLGHASWDHFFGNIMMLLVVGPLLEEKYGSANILFVILTTALVTGVINFILFPHVQLLGASGVVFAFILLASFTSIEDGKSR